MPNPRYILKSAFQQLILVSLFLRIAGQMYALFPLIDGRVDITTEIKEQYDSNIGSSPTDPISDRILTIRPGATYLRDAGLLVLNMDVGLEVGRFYEDQRLNYDNPQGTIGISYPNQGESKWQFSLNSSYIEASSPNPIIGERISSETFTTLGNLRYSILPIYGIGVNVARSTIQSNISPSGTRLSDLDQDTMGALFFYKYSELLELTLNYRFRDNKITGNPTDVFSLADAAKMSGKDKTVSVGAIGQLTSLLTGGIEVGGQRRRHAHRPPRPRLRQRPHRAAPRNGPQRSRSPGRSRRVPYCEHNRGPRRPANLGPPTQPAGYLTVELPAYPPNLYGPHSH